jgi:transcriptional regulator with XRE-family HTH domain
MIEQRYKATGAWETLKAQGRTIRWLAQHVGVSENTLTKYKRGHRQSIPASVAVGISNALGVPIDLLFCPLNPVDGTKRADFGERAAD